MSSHTAGRARRSNDHESEDEMYLGFYKLIKQIGAGGFGEVWEAVDGSGQKFAIKKLRDR